MEGILLTITVKLAGQHVSQAFPMNGRRLLYTAGIIAGGIWNFWSVTGCIKSNIGCWNKENERKEEWKNVHMNEIINGWNKGRKDRRKGGRFKEEWLEGGKEGRREGLEGGKEGRKEGVGEREEGRREGRKYGQWSTHPFCLPIIWMSSGLPEFFTETYLSTVHTLQFRYTCGWKNRYSDANSIGYSIVHL